LTIRPLITVKIKTGRSMALYMILRSPLTSATHPFSLAMVGVRLDTFLSFGWRSFTPVMPLVPTSQGWNRTILLLPSLGKRGGIEPPLLVSFVWLCR
jgi:hypothetical protein